MLGWLMPLTWLTGALRASFHGILAPTTDRSVFDLPLSILPATDRASVAINRQSSAGCSGATLRHAVRPAAGDTLLGAALDLHKKPCSKTVWRSLSPRRGITMASYRKIFTRPKGAAPAIKHLLCEPNGRSAAEVIRPHRMTLHNGFYGT
jgi:hypothetical protein